MRGDGCWHDYPEKKQSGGRRVTRRGEKNEGTRDVEGDREEDRVIRDNAGKKIDGLMDGVVKKKGGEMSR